MDFANYWFSSGAGGGGYQITNSLRFRGSQYLRRTPSSSGNGQTHTTSFWAKRTEIDTDRYLFGAGNGGSFYSGFTFNSSGEGGWNYVKNDGMRPFFEAGNSFLDPSAWYHFVVVADTTQSNGSLRDRFYINGVEYRNFPVWQNVSNQNQSLPWLGSTAPHYVGSIYNGQSPLRGFMAEFHCVDGQALAPTEFGEFDDNGVWVPIEYTGSHGSQGFYLDFSDPSNIGADRSGNNNNFTPTNFDLSNSSSLTYDGSLDSPTNNMHVWNPYFVTNQSNSNQLGTLTLAPEYNLLRATQGGNLTRGGYSTGALWPGGKYYWEAEQGPNWGGQAGCKSMIGFGVTRATQNISTSLSQWIWYGLLWEGTGLGQGSSLTATIYWNGSAQSTISLSNDWRPGRVAGIAIDTTATTNNVLLYVNGTQVGTGSFNFGALPFEARRQQIYTAIGSQPNQFTYLNSGNLPFKYTPPSGYSEPGTANLPDMAVPNPGELFNCVTYTGNGGSQSITGVGFQPDMVWIKNRTGGNSHSLFDVVRGANRDLSPNQSIAETTNNSNGYLSSFNTDGFTLANGGGDTNGNGNGYVAWCWKEQSGVLDIVTYSGTSSAQNISHNLGAVPAVMIIKARNANSSWQVYHQHQGNQFAVFLDQNSLGVSGDNTRWNSTSPTSTQFTVGTDGGMNGSGRTFVAYLFAEINGFTAFGKYKGNSQTNFVYTGFRPAMIITKNVSTGDNWNIYDKARNPYNPVNKVLYPDLANSEDTLNNSVDFLANGFYLDDYANNSNQDYIYMAFAEHCFGGGNVGAAPAR